MTAAEFVATVDAFLAAPKIALRADEPMDWSLGRDAGELRVSLPLEVSGEAAGQTLMVQFYPTYPLLMFRLSVNFEPVVCRLDFELDGTHGNNLAEPRENLPPVIHGPHYHAWPLNRRLVTSSRAPLKLKNALPLQTQIRQFDAALRFFCADNNIVLPRGHRIELPDKRSLL